MYKICVYAICKNESKFINRWLESVKEADYICVLDTGSTDNSVDLLKENGVIVESKIISPWRFDEARNESIKLIPTDTDICVCVDIDEVLKKGWRLELEKIWDNTITRVRYIYNWS
ncbi:MAG: glycosyltransferase family 2 protein, partial [Bacilli bacterium]|nr:glycosyltransferase family 2 protein [Bacilli bacterium]